MEANVLSIASDEVFSELVQRTTTLHHRADATGERSGLICAGRQTMVYFIAEPGDADRYRAFASAIDTQQPVELWIEDGAPSIRDADLAGAPVRLEGNAYVERAVNPHRIAIVGGGHCGLALSRTMQQLGYHVAVFETRPDVHTFTENEFANERIVVDDYAEAAALVRHPEQTHFVVMTSGLPSDVRGLLGAVDVPFPFKGVMGSSAKIKRIREELASQGATDKQIGELVGPIGLPMTSNTPEEIAVSIAGQILALREQLFPWSQPSPLG